ncbi:hypothetical protein MKW98_003338 [Papaver atlanticum]|uniref:Uncharacterized protein n=1 Tax=Papaver atlanticum TaxID=357466 RepID=A0AAD4TBA2_9MAGN|nr:hypothetical protein MKW98_003338 [Papaver atlanticum]
MLHSYDSSLLSSSHAHEIRLRNKLSSQSSLTRGFETGGNYCSLRYALCLEEMTEIDDARAAKSLWSSWFLPKKTLL